MKIPRIPDKYVRPLYLWAWGAVSFCNLTAVFFANGNWVNFLAAAAFGVAAVAGYRQRTRDAESARRRTYDHAVRARDRQFWAAVLNESDSALQRKLAVEMLDYLGNPVSVDPLADPRREPVTGPQSPSGVSSANVRSPAELRDAVNRKIQADIEEMAAQLTRQGMDLGQVIALRERHQLFPQPSSPRWIAACELLIEAAGVQAGYVQDVEEIAVRNWDGSVCTSYTVPSGPSVRDQMLTDLKRAEKEIEDGVRAAFIVASDASRPTYNRRMWSA